MRSNMIQCSTLINLLIPIALVLAPLVLVDSQSSSTNLPIASTTTTTTSKPPVATSEIFPIATTTTTSNQSSSVASTTSATVTTTTAPSEVLLSGNEFVDYTEAPIPLFDGISNDTKSDVTTTPSSVPPDSSVVNNSTLPTTNQPPAVGSSKSNLNDTTPVTTTVAPPDDTGETGDAGDLEVGDGDVDDPAGDSKDLSSKQAYEPPKNVSQYMDYIERLFHDLRHQITDLFEPHIPQLIRTSQMVQLSGSCSYDMLRMALALRQFEPWALRMIDSSGKVPEGIFEGSFTALGSYDECIGTVFAPKGEQQQQQPHPTQGKYCLVNVSPFLPPKPPADKVELMFQEEANRRNYTKDDQFSRLSPMFYYMKFRIGVCIPSTCVDSDLESISSALSSSLRLNITIPHCRIKQSQPMTSHQIAGGLVFALVLALVCGATLMDYWRKKLDRLRRRERILVLDVGNHLHIPSGDSRFSAPSPHSGAVIWQQQKQQCDISAFGDSEPSTEVTACNRTTTSTTKFVRRLDKHWSWMSFSLLTNYKLYFGDDKAPSDAQVGDGETKKVQQDAGAEPNAMVIRCLNGIRVISLCWVIVANSYITLDPRATKRLVKTREAPKDFLFQLVAQASLAIETFFFLSGILLSLSFARRLRPETLTDNKKIQSGDNNTANKPSRAIEWIHFYVHRYVRMTPATMLVIAFTMFAFRYGDGPLWFEATHKAHMSCSENWWRHLLHVANFIDTRQMCFIHYWYIAADMQLFLFAPVLMFLLYQRRRIGYALAALIGSVSIGSVFYTTYMRNLPPTLLFYNSDPESRREFGNTIMTKPLTHALPYMVGMLVGKWLTSDGRQVRRLSIDRLANQSLRTFIGLMATLVALAEVFLPYKWNNSHLPTRFLAALYASLFRLSWSLVLAYLVISCAHPRGKRCPPLPKKRQRNPPTQTELCLSCSKSQPIPMSGTFDNTARRRPEAARARDKKIGATYGGQMGHKADELDGDEFRLCFCGYGGHLVNRLLSLNVFTHLSRLSFVAYLIHLPLMSVFIAQTRGLFAFSHTLVIHLALSYLVMTFVLSFLLVHIIEFPFITFERYLFKKLFYKGRKHNEATMNGGDGSKKSVDKRSSSSPPMNQVISHNNKWMGERMVRLDRKSASQVTPSYCNGNETFKISERL